MNTRKIKTLLHESIENINDESLLMTVKEILERQYTPKTDVTLTDWQISRIEESKRQIKEGKSHSEGEADDIIGEWLKK